MLDQFGLSDEQRGELRQRQNAAMCPPPEIDDPLTGEIIDTDSIDAMLDRFDALDEFNRKLYGVLLALRRAIAAKTEGGGVTRRVAGRLRRAKVVMPDESFDQTKLKELWHGYPALAQEFLKIDTVGVRKREYAKLVGTASDQEDFCAFRDALKAANCGRTGTPKVFIEKGV